MMWTPVDGAGCFEMCLCPILELENVGLLNSIVFQQDWVAAHYAVDVHSFRNNYAVCWTT